MGRASPRAQFSPLSHTSCSSRHALAFIHVVTSISGMLLSRDLDLSRFSLRSAINMQYMVFWDTCTPPTMIDGANS